MAIMTVISRKPLSFVLPSMGLLGALFGILMGMSMGNAGLGIMIGAAVSVGLSYVTILSAAKEKMMRWSLFFLSLISGYYAFGPAGMIAGGLWGWFYGWFVFWLFEGRYRARLHSYLTSGQVLWHFTFRLICGAVFAYLIMPIIVVMPLSFNAQNYFTFTPEMLQFDPAGYSLKHYMDFFYNNEWQRSFKNSLIIAPIATVISVTLGTLAAIGLSQSHVPFKRLITALLISPMIVPLIISATGMFFFYATVGNFLENSLGIDKNLVGYVKVILAHSVLGIPFVIITVTATLVGFDNSLTRASANMGAGPVKTFFKVQMPLIMPGVVAGGLFAFITSFDEVVVIMFVGSSKQKTLPWQMFIGLKEQISPTILAVATILVCMSIALLVTLELLRRRSERLRGLSPS
ncbi:MAG: ABC transporter permease [Planktomarina sp.]|jgi:putative spermidine/putrescine transport system permease protein|nr:ABC transporter permease [Planktomarina sp.]MDA9100386.1 ABC transporter permease [Planktomarina sp.]MDS9949610.1 ABC transporter permease [Planktomarina sp.]